MATVAAIAIKRDTAIQRIAAAAEGIASELGVEALSLPLTDRDPEMLRAEQLETIAVYLENVQKAITPEKPDEVEANDDDEKAVTPKSKAKPKK